MLRRTLQRLYNKRRVTKSTQRELKRAIKVGNECAHGEPTTWHEVEWLVGVVQIFMMAYPLPSWFEGVAAAG